MRVPHRKAQSPRQRRGRNRYRWRPATAKAVDAALTKRRNPGPLHGLPVTIKDSFDSPGCPIHWACRNSEIANPPATRSRCNAIWTIVQLRSGLTWRPTCRLGNSRTSVYGTTSNPSDVDGSPGG